MIGLRVYICVCVTAGACQSPGVYSFRVGTVLLPQVSVFGFDYQQVADCPELGGVGDDESEHIVGAAL